MACRVRVRIHGYLGQSDGAPEQVILPNGTTFGDLLTALGLRPGNVGPVFQNGRLAPTQGKVWLTDGDVFDLYPVAGGGG